MTKANEPIAMIPGDGCKHIGLTKREYFAGLAMQGLLSAVYSSKEMINEFMKKKYAPGPFDNVGEYLTGCEAVSRNAVSYADALLAELEKGEKNHE